MTSYLDTHRASIENPEEFWGKAAEGIDWEKRWDSVLVNPDPLTYRWFAGGKLNTCYNALDRHVERGRGDQAAIIYDSAATDTKRTISYADLLGAVSRFAGVLAANGISKGDRVIVYMPMIPEAIVAVLACARLGAVHSVVFGGFAAAELATRIDAARPK
ncbi:MAG: AMP-binding protein, partial [Gammaproteobacteria bacterium]|nr:AMP-binding protein [Gammaproteobacteria bacterium]